MTITTEELANMKNHLPAVDRAVAELRQGLDRSAPMAELADLANSVADALVEPVKVGSTCKRGCSHCCRQSKIMIDEADAVLLSKMSGLAMDTPDYTATTNFEGVACVFLDTDTDSCSIYKHRPMTCRLSVSIDDPMKCKTEEYRQMVDLRHANHEIIRLVGPRHLKAHDVARGNLKPADIRQFFKP